MDLFTQVRTNLVMFVVIIFLLYLVIRYFYQSVRITKMDNSLVSEGFAEEEEQAQEQEQEEEDIPEEKEDMFGLKNSLNIPIWEDKESKKKSYKIKKTRNLVEWSSLKAPSDLISRELSLNNMSFSFWIRFDPSVTKRPKTTIFRIVDKTNNIVPFSVSTVADKPILEINYLTEDKVTLGSNLISRQNDLYGGNQIGGGLTYTFVFITIQNGVIRLVLNGVEQNKFGGEKLFEPDNGFIFDSGHDASYRWSSSGILIRNFKIYAEPVMNSTVKMISDNIENSRQGFTTRTGGGIFESFFSKLPDSLNNLQSSTVSPITPPNKAEVQMKDLVLNKMGLDCNIGGVFNDTRDTYKVYSIKNGNKDVTGALAPLLGKRYNQAEFEKIVPWGTLHRTNIKAQITNDHGEPDSFELPYGGGGRYGFFHKIGQVVKERNTKEIEKQDCLPTETCSFFNAQNQSGKCVATNINQAPGRTESTFDITTFRKRQTDSTNKERTVSFVDLDGYHYYTFPPEKLVTGDQGTTFSFWFQLNPGNFNKDTPEDTFLYLMHCGNEDWEMDNLKLKNDVSISVNSVGDVKFQIGDYSETRNLFAADGYPHHIGWVIDQNGYWSLYHNGTRILSIKKTSLLPNIPRDFNMVGGTPLLKYNLKQVSIGEFKLYNYSLNSANIKSVFETNTL